MTLFINACVREESRTKKLADELLEKLGDYKEIKLDELNIKPLDRAGLKKRTALLSAGNYMDSDFDLARDFASADIIVIAAPYWDGSFPSILKTYIENIYITGIVSKYSENGIPQGLCHATKLYYITTAGGPYNPAYSYNYIKDLATNMFGINECELIYKENLDII